MKHSEGTGNRVFEGVQGDLSPLTIPIPKVLRKSHPVRKRLKYQGLDVSIESPAGSMRRGTDQDGHDWESMLHFDYGYIRNTMGLDSDAVDCFIGPNKDAKKIFVIHQRNTKTGKFDEDKCMLGWLTKADAKRDYLLNYDRTDQYMGMTVMTVDEFTPKVLATRAKPMMIKAIIRTHQRKTKSGKITTVREHEDKRTPKTFKDYDNTHEFWRHPDGEDYHENLGARVASDKLGYHNDMTQRGIVEALISGKKLKTPWGTYWATKREKPLSDMFKAKIKAHTRTTKTGKVVQVREHEDIRHKWHRDSVAAEGKYRNWLRKNPEAVKEAESLAREVKKKRNMPHNPTPEYLKGVSKKAQEMKEAFDTKWSARYAERNQQAGKIKFGKIGLAKKIKQKKDFGVSYEIWEGEKGFAFRIYDTDSGNVAHLHIFPLNEKYSAADRADRKAAAIEKFIEAIKYL